MPKDSDSPTKPPKNGDETKDKVASSPEASPGSPQETPSSSKKPSHLRLVVSNPPKGAQEEDEPLTPSSQPLPYTGFRTKISKIGGVYRLLIQDPFHDLEGEFYLEIEKQKRGKAAICHFPLILDEDNKFLQQDETLYGVIAVQFQLMVLKRMFQFCQRYRIPRLILYIENEQAQGFEVYHNFLGYYDEGLAVSIPATEMVIPTSGYAFTALRQFIKANSHKMEQGLWHDQKSNKAIRQYLKTRIKEAWKQEDI